MDSADSAGSQEDSNEHDSSMVEFRYTNELDESSQQSEHEEVKEKDGKLFFSTRLLPTVTQAFQKLGIHPLIEGNQVTVSSSDISQHELCNLRIRSYDLPQWIEAVGDLTFPSLLFDLSPPELVTLGELLNKSFNDTFWTEPNSPLQDLRTHMREQMADKIWFTKLSSVSPKDLEAFLQVKTPEQALQLLCKSKRTSNVIKLALKNSTSVQIVLREWFTCDEEWEFRVFVYGGKVTAISQYIWDQRFDHLQSSSFLVTLKQEIINYWEDHLKVRAYLHYSVLIVRGDCCRFRSKIGSLM